MGRSRSIVWWGTASLAALLVFATLVLLSAAASGVETVPENTVPPTISPNPPIEGETATATQGTWNGSPTSYTYAWYVCNGTGSCVSIPSATKSTYVPADPELHKRLRVVVTASNTAGSGSALSEATSPVKIPPSPYFWSACKKTGTGAYTNSTCSVLGAGGFEWGKIAAATPTSFTAESTSSFIFKFEIFSTLFTVTCKSQSSSGTIENPTGGKAGTVPSASFKMFGCTFNEPATACKLPEGAISLVALKGTTTEAGESRRVILEPASGTTVMTLKIEGAGCPVIGSYVIAGTIGANDNPTTSSLEFTKTSSSLKPFGSETNAPTLEGTTKIQTTLGESLKLVP